MSEGKLIGLAAGGTGGQMFPAEALAREMKRRGWRVILFTDKRGMRYGETFPADILLELPASNPAISGVKAKAATGFALMRAVRQSLAAIGRHKPDIMVGFGGYPSAPAMLAARLRGIPHGVHEQNAVLGRVNRLVAPKADFVAHAFAQLDRLPEKRTGALLELGNPVRDAMMQKARAPYVAPAEFRQIDILVFGGSQGAALFSRVVPAAISELPERLRQRVKITQQVREEEQEAVAAVYAEAGLQADLRPFFADMPERLARAHLVISRAGASSVTEIATVGRPAILVPLAIAMDDHQSGNARVLEACGAAKVMSEGAFSADTLRETLAALLTGPATLAQMAKQALTVAPERATIRLADHVEAVVAGKV